MSSQALTKRDSETSLMPPPPPPQRIKRPATVLDEDVYTDALSHIIARDYFPGLRESQVKQEYLDALDSKNQEWIASSRRKLRDLIMTPGRSRPRPDSRNMTPGFRGAGAGAGAGALGDTPMGWGGDTPVSVVSAVSTSSTTTTMTAQQTDPAPDVSKMGLLEFQAKYTGEDNESFNKLLDKQNAKRREKHAWLWNNNKIPSARQIAHRRREAKLIEARGGKWKTDQEKQIAIKTDLDARPAQPDTWKPAAENSLMFPPSSVEDTHETIQQKAEAASRAGPKRVVYQNTRLAEAIFADGARSGPGTIPPPSPSISAIQDAIAGRPRPTDSEAFYTGGETPRVNGYAFVDEDEPEPEPTTTTTTTNDDDLRMLGGAGDTTPNPFQIKANRRREDLHHRMVDKAARTKRAEKIAQLTKTPVSVIRTGTSTPRFASSPKLDFGLRTPGQRLGQGGGGGGPNTKMLTPAAQKLLSQVGSTPSHRGSSSSSSSSSSASRLKNLWTLTPRRQK
ncbi:hypothetical protein ARAM_000278 [Aspergillus rambellii]|uniref:Nuclear protein n=1 Tax=Aspergillus rambellii TaxID=308745 RepID=A0A0F8XB15_9EURO|nr:hypothetical protein ARAM_000278 [Aspergillus rambellii]